MLKRLIFGLAAAAMAIPFLQAKPVQAADTADIVLHKRVHTNPRHGNKPWSFQNDGTLKADSELGDTEPLNGVTFDLYDATAEYQAALAKGQTAQEFITEWRSKPRKQAIAEAEKTMTLLETKVTETEVLEDGVAEDGIARFTVSRKRGGQYAAYLLLETKVEVGDHMDIDITQHASPTMIVMPQRDVEGNLMDIVHLYAKNVAYVRDPYFFKFGLNTDGKEVRLAGAVFALYKYVNGEKHYLSTVDSTDSPLTNRWIASSDALTDAEVDKFISDEDGLVNTGIRFVPSGTFYFEELKSVPGYSNNLGANGVKVEVPTSWTNDDGTDNPVLVNGEVLVETTDGVVPDSQITVGRPRVYNYQKTSTTPDKGVTTTPVSNNKTPTSSGKLPQTGSMVSAMLILAGLLVMTAAWWLGRRRLTN